MSCTQLGVDSIAYKDLFAPVFSSSMLQETTEITPISKIEERFAVIRKSDTEFVGKHPLQQWSPELRGTYGGEFVSQGLLAAWELVEDLAYSPHSFHSYFLAAGLDQLEMRYEVTTTSQGKNYCSRLVKCYQLHTERLCFIMMASFTRNNLIAQRKKEYAELTEQEKFHPRTKVPVEFLRTPHYLFDKYIDKIDQIPTLHHPNDIVHAVPPEVLRASKGERFDKDAGVRQLGAFYRMHDDHSVAKDKLKARFLLLTFLSDSFYLGTLTRVLGLTLFDKLLNFFRVSLDHAVYFHDNDFDPTEWMFFDWKFVRMSNDRVLVTALIFTKDKRLIATLQQEALSILPLSVVERTHGVSYKL